MAEQDNAVDPSLIKVTIGTVIVMAIVGYVITSLLNG